MASNKKPRLTHAIPEIESALLEFEKKQAKSSPKKVQIIKAPNFSEMLQRRHPMVNPMVQKTSFFQPKEGKLSQICSTFIRR